ncbi:hypothetical protein [Actinomycetospora lutea]|uniref:hypothetical protein n=1 Tax=Actinomycetospora lutea TaxID=663604 RepID=UPI003B673994
MSDPASSTSPSITAVACSSDSAEVPRTRIATRCSSMRPARQAAPSRGRRSAASARSSTRPTAVRDAASTTRSSSPAAGTSVSARPPGSSGSAREASRAARWKHACWCASWRRCAATNRTVSYGDTRMGSIRSSTTASPAPVGSSSSPAGTST